MNGLTKGAQHIARLIAFLYWAFTSGNTAAITDALNVAGIWFKELTGAEITAVSWTLAPSRIVVGLWQLATSDPFKGSRDALTACLAKYPASSN